MEDVDVLGREVRGVARSQIGRNTASSRTIVNTAAARRPSAARGGSSAMPSRAELAVVKTRIITGVGSGLVRSGMYRLVRDDYRRR